MALAACDLQIFAHYPMALGYILSLSGILIILQGIKILTVLTTKFFVRAPLTLIIHFPDL
jgi:hypothetical protein